MHRITLTIQHLIAGSGSAEGSWVLGHVDQAGQDHLHNDSQGSARFPSPRVAPTNGTAVEVEAAASVVVAAAVASALEGAR